MPVSILNTNNNGIKEPSYYENCKSGQMLMYDGYVMVRKSLCTLETCYLG